MIRELTKKGFKGINIYESVYNEAQKFIWEYNSKCGYKKIRSMAHLVELALEEYLQKHRVVLKEEKEG